jgi:RimJ/RimL family protein N-acetyltransferase
MLFNYILDKEGRTMNDLMMREATLKDYDAYYKIKCDPKNVEWSGFSTPPDYERLKGRFETFFQDDKQGLLLFEFDEEVIGYVNFFSTLDGNSVETSHGALTGNKVSGLGYKMLKMAVEFIDNSENCRDAKSIIGWVAENNFASLQNILKNGYQPTGESEVRMLNGNNVTFVQYEKARGKK